MSIKNKAVLVVGPVFVDSIYSGLPAFPELGKEVYGDHHIVTIGGSAITAIGLARLGVSSGIATAIGADLFGDFVADRLQKEGVNCEGLIKIASERTNSTAAIVYAGDRGFVSYSGAELPESELVEKWAGTDTVGAAFENIAHMHVGLRADPGLGNLLATARESGVTTSVVCGWDGVEFYADQPEKLGRILANTDLFFCNQLEAETIAKQQTIEAAVEFFGQYSCHPVITLGADGAITLDEDNKIVKVSALQVEFLDATGAGDSFAAGFIAGRMLGYDVKKTLQLGVICGSLSTRALGGTEAFPTTLSEALSYTEKI